ncbi:MAG: MarR family winged helix-turn-helix transcriptional regulator [Nanoarchaeota archaeon]
MYRFIINKKYVNLLRAIARPGKHDILGISRETGITYSRMSNIVMQFAREGIVKKDRSDEGPGMKLDVSITEKGKMIIEFFNKIAEIMEEKIIAEKIKNERGWKNGG